jgi:futalosine hydrolase
MTAKVKSERRSGKLLIGLIASVPLEGKFLVRKLGLTRMKTRAVDQSAYRGPVGDTDILYAVSGIGKTNASHTVTWMIREYSPAMIINFGIGGAYPSAGLAVGDIAVASREVYADEGVILQNGLQPLETIGIPFLKMGRSIYFNEFPLDAVLGEKALNAAGLHTRARLGTFATVSACTGTKERAEEFSLRYGAICENMEGAAVVHICCRYGIPCVEIRGISNIVEGRDAGGWNIELASDSCQRVVLEFIRMLGK